MEGIVITGGVSLLLPGYAPVIQGTGVKTVGIDFSDIMGQYIKDGTLESVIGGHVAGGAYAVIMVVNRLYDHPLVEGPAFIKDNFLDVTPENVDDLDTCYFHKQFYTDEELRSCVYAFNENASMDDLQQLIDEYSISFLMEKYQ